MPQLRAFALLLVACVLVIGSGTPVSATTTDRSAAAVIRANHPVPWKYALRLRTPAPVAPKPAPSPAPRPTAVDPVALSARILALVNVERTARGLGALRASGCATGYAVRWSVAMATTGVFKHQALSPIMTGCQARGAGENIAYGARSAEQFMSLWMNSPGHRDNILRPQFTHLGVGLAVSSSGVLYATQDFLSA